MRSGRACAILLVSLLAPQPPNTPAVHFSAGESARSIPFDLVGGRIVLRVGVNGSAPVSFILDTGADVNAIGLSYARSTGIGLVPWTGGFVGIGDHAPEVHLATDAMSFSLPGVELSDSQTFVISLDETHDCLGRNPRLDGFLGMPFFRSLVVEIDYRSRLLNLYDPSSYAYAGHGRIVPIEFDSMYSYVNVQVAAPRRPPVRAKLVIDTGAGALSLTKQFAKSHGILPAAETLIPGAECGSAGRSAEPTLVGTIDRLQIGGFTLSHLQTVFYQATADRTYDGLLGSEILRHFKVIFDYSRHRMILEPS